MASYDNVSLLSQRVAVLFNDVHPDALALLEHLVTIPVESGHVEPALLELMIGLVEGHRVELLNIGLISVSGLSEEKILEHLNVTTTQGKKCEGEVVVDSCAICLSGYQENEKMATLQCGHGFHVECIKSWLVRKNVCPMCRAAALKI